MLIEVGLQLEHLSKKLHFNGVNESFLFEGILVSCCLCNKLNLMILTVHVYSLIVLDIRSLTQVSRVGRPASLLEALGENRFPCLFWLLEAVHFPWLMTPSSIFKANKVGLIPSHITSLWPSLLSPSATYKDPYVDTGPTWIIQANLFILKSAD